MGKGRGKGEKRSEPHANARLLTKGERFFWGGEGREGEGEGGFA